MQLHANLMKNLAKLCPHALGRCAAPALESLTERVYERTKVAKEIKHVKLLDFDLDALGTKVLIKEQFMVSNANCEWLERPTEYLFPLTFSEIDGLTSSPVMRHLLGILFYMHECGRNPVAAGCQQAFVCVCLFVLACVFQAEVIDGTEDWMQLMKAVFHFPSIRRLVQSPSFSFVFDGMHGVAGPTAERLFVHELGAKPSSLRSCKPLVCAPARNEMSSGAPLCLKSSENFFS